MKGVGGTDALEAARTALSVAGPADTLGVTEVVQAVDGIADALDAARLAT